MVLDSELKLIAGDWIEFVYAGSNWAGTIREIKGDKILVVTQFRERIKINRRTIQTVNNEIIERPKSLVSVLAKSKEKK
jgi:elongation factor P hydroxylase